MAEQSEPKHPAEEIIKFWQSWMSAGMEAMQRTAAMFAPGAGFAEMTAGLRDQIEKGMRAALEAAKVPSADDFHCLVEELGNLRSRVEAMQTGLATLESLVKAQHEVWQNLERTVQQAMGALREMQRAMTTWSGQWEDRLAGFARGQEEWRQRWEEMVRQGVAMGQASQRSLEDLTKTVWDLSRKVMGGQG